MKKFLSSFLSGVMLVPVTVLAQSTRTVDADYITRNYGERNYVKNPGAEVNVSDVTVTGSGTPTITRSTATPLYGNAHFNVNLKQALNNRATWSLNNLDQVLKNGSCSASFFVNNVTIGTGATLHGQIYQGTNLVGQVQVQGGSDPQSYVINFPCGDLSSATTFEMRLTTAGTTDTTFNIDDIRVGKATNLSNIGQKEFIGEIRYTWANNCWWQTSSTSYVNYAADPDCNTPIAKGKATTSAGKIPGGTFVNLAPGDYLVEAFFTGRKDGTADEGANYRLSDGTTNSGGVTQYAQTFVNTSSIVLSHIFSYSTAVSSVTFQVQGLSSNASNQASIFLANSMSQPGFVLRVWRIPSQAELAITPEQAARLSAGEIFPWAGTTCPVGSLPADGQSLNRSDYPELFAAIGTAHGAPSSTTFNLPDYRGRFLRGVDGSAGRDPDASSRTAMNSGGNTGNNVGSVQNDAFASHTHTLNNSGIINGLSASNRQEVIYVPSADNPSPGFAGGSVAANGNNAGVVASVTASSTGGNETRPKNAYVNLCIRTVNGGSGNVIIMRAEDLVDDRATSVNKIREYKNNIAGFSNRHSVNISYPSYKSKLLVSMSNTFRYTNSNGTGMNTRTIFRILDSTGVLYTSPTITLTVPAGYNDIMSDSISAIINYPSGTLTVECYEENVGGGAYSASNSLFSASVTAVRVE